MSTISSGTTSTTTLVHSGDTTGSLVLKTNDTGSGGTTAMTIDTSQNVGIGTSSPGSSPSGQLVVAGANVAFATNENANLVVRSTDAAATNKGGMIGFAGTSESGNITFATMKGAKEGTDSGYLAFATRTAAAYATERMRIDSAGALILAGSTAQKATGTTWSNPSDVRLKDNIRDYAKGMAELMQVRVREWEYNGKGGTVAGTKGLGVVADEAMLVLPDTVDTYEAKLDADDEQATAIKKFDATEITWLLVKAVQEQTAIIASLTARLDAANL